jgi:hypothetical protein
VNVQPNLATRDGELERELERMRALIARVGGRVEGLGEAIAQEEEVEDMEVDERAKVEALLGLR